jgi:tyrosyl-tRNA synthetase
MCRYTRPPMPGSVFEDLVWRGLVAHSTDADALRSLLDGEPISFYCGFDPTAPSLEFGNLVQLATMRRLQLAGHRPIVVVGGATGLIGDPSGRSAERALNAEEVVADWVDRIREQVQRYLAFEGDNAARIVNNLEWTGPMTAITFLRDVGKHFGVNRMLDKEVVSARLQAGGISYTEFSYQILQALDYLELHRRYGAVLQTGGSDQWGNLTAGVDLIRRVDGDTVHALATPLITKADGTKYGKTAGGSVWLDPTMTSPFAFYQYFLNQADADVGPLLRVFSFRSHEEIEGLDRLVASEPEQRAAQTALAGELTALVHGDDAVEEAIAASRALFGDGDLTRLDMATIDAALAEVVRIDVESADGLPSMLDLAVNSGLFESRGAAKQGIAQGGFYVNNQRVTDGAAAPSRGDLLHGRWLLLRRGKRTLAAVEVH